jgi:cell division initiation protein
MDNSQAPASILDTLRTVEFRLGLKGYNVDEVDEYLEKAAVEAEALQEQMRQLTERLRQASERIAHLESERRESAEAPAAAPQPVAEPVADDSLQRTLLLAQKFVDQAKRDSEAEASQVIAQAEERARATLAGADERARQMVTDAERRLREEVVRLEGMRTQLASDVENMARHLEAERGRLRTSLTEVLKWVDENIQPANALMALRPRSGEGPRTGEVPRTPAAPRPVGPGSEPGAGHEGEGNGAQVLDLRAGAAQAPGGTGPGEHR